MDKLFKVLGKDLLNYGCVEIFHFFNVGWKLMGRLLARLIV